jgi:hypothetical protein
MAWLPATSLVVAPARSAVVRCNAGARSSGSAVVTKYQLGLLRQAGSVTVPLSASKPHGICESAMNALSFRRRPHPPALLISPFGSRDCRVWSAAG